MCLWENNMAYLEEDTQPSRWERGPDFSDTAPYGLSILLSFQVSFCLTVDRIWVVACLQLTH